MMEKRANEEEAIDLGRAKDFLFSLFGRKGKKLEKEETKIADEIGKEVGMEWRKIWPFIVKYQIVFWLLIPMFLSIFFRAYPASLPITDDWARNAVYNNIRADIEQQIDMQYPNLLVANKKTIVDSEFQKALEQQKAQVEAQIKATSEYFKSQFRYTAEDGKEYTYLSDIDTWMWYGEARNYLKNGFFGTAIADGKDINFLRNGRRGVEISATEFHPFFGAMLYKIVDIFSNIPFMQVFFWLSVIIITASIIPAFFIGKRLGGNVGGFFAGVFVAINGALLARTPAAVADTDPWNIFFPLMIIWLFLEAFEAKSRIKQIILAGLSGLLVGLYSYAWAGWWFVLCFIIVTLAIYLVYGIIRIKYFKDNYTIIKESLILGTVFFLFSAISVTLSRGFTVLISTLRGPSTVITMKQVGVTSIWPNVLTTVAEFNETPLKTIIQQMDGSLFFILAIIGIIMMFFKKDREGKPDTKCAILMVIWFIGTAYGFTKGSRFAILMVPAFAIAFGTCLGTIYQNASAWISKEMKFNINIVKIILVFMMLLLLISPMKEAQAIGKGQVIMMNDGWYDSLQGIKNNSTDAIITSWWDFGHWFVTIGERRATFDGADQGMRIHWVGKTLVTNSEKESLDILKMLNCDQDYAYQKMENYTKDPLRAVNLVYEIISKDKEEARQILQQNKLTEEQINDMLASTHCDNLLDQYYIASEDMVGKAGVWGHFGSWNFNRAKMYNTVKGKSQDEGMGILEKDFNLSANEAFKIYYEIQNQNGDQWITSWPSYISGIISCSETNTSIECNVGLQMGNLVINSFVFDKEARDAYFKTNGGDIHPQSVVYPIRNQANEPDVYEKNYIENAIGISVSLIEKDNQYSIILSDPKLANSMFTRLFFYEGRGLKHFELFSQQQQITGEKIYVYKVKF